MLGILLKRREIIIHIPIDESKVIQTPSMAPVPHRLLEKIDIPAIQVQAEMNASLLMRIATILELLICIAMIRE